MKLISFCRPGQGRGQVEPAPDQAVPHRVADRAPPRPSEHHQDLRYRDRGDPGLPGRWSTSRAITLEHYYSFDRMLPMHRAVSAVFKCAMALDYAYRQGVIHRDIKPANILINKNYEVKITDFGLALDMLKKSESDSTFIMGVGSPAYMSPEQIKGYPLDQKTDLYSLGVVLFHLLTGRLPVPRQECGSAHLPHHQRRSAIGVAAQFGRAGAHGRDHPARRWRRTCIPATSNGAEFAKDLTSVRFQILDDDWVPVNHVRA
ncbi:MAG: serine/threonine protein kinase [Comamonadaceae bacterium]|nr:serine/threonine protein kinase [Comamonadaceae bacterium]